MPSVLRIISTTLRATFSGVLDCQFHPDQPWIFTAGADHLVRLYT